MSRSSQHKAPLDMSFKILQKDGKARAGELVTPHGVTDTPNFIPVGTKATVKAISPKDLKEIGVQVILANTYHLMLQPGADLIEKFKGLHKFMGWDGPIMTDSGGFQVFSLGVGLESGEGKVLRGLEKEDLGKRGGVRLAKVTDEGVTFESHIDGSKHFLGPEESIKIQVKLGADLIVAFDDHESIKMDYGEALRSLELTEKWALQSKATFDKISHDRGQNCQQLLYGVVHGALHKDLRVRSAKFTDENFEGIAIGGIYGTKVNLYEIVEWVVDGISEDKPRHLLGIGEVEDLFNGVERGVDFFDCVAPTRRARNGSLYISPKVGHIKNNFTLNISQSKFINDKKGIDPDCHCYTCQNFSRAYLNHLYKSSELLYYNLATYHNVFFVENLMRQIREAIKFGQFKKLKASWI